MERRGRLWSGSLGKCGACEEERRGGVRAVRLCETDGNLGSCSAKWVTKGPSCGPLLRILSRRITI